MINTTNTYSQTISRSVISSGGRYISTTSAGLFANIGEISVTTFNAGTILTQGFVQPANPLVTEVSEKEIPKSLAGLYPNPTKGNVYINLCESCKLLSFELFDYQGKKINLNIGLQKISDVSYLIDISSLNNGMYIFKLLDSGDKNNFRIIKLIKTE